jgi:hypothetical protein
LDEVLKERLSSAALVLNKSQNEIVVEALQSYLDDCGVGNPYQLTLTKDSVVLLELSDPPTVIETSARNGVLPEALKLQYQNRFNRPVRLVVQEEGAKKR